MTVLQRIAMNRSMLHRCRSVFILMLLCGCATLPENTGRTPSYALQGTNDTALGQAITARTTANPGKDGVHLLISGRDAFAMRMALAQASQRSLDLQYYIWKPDTVGQLMLKEVWLAAERGVRVRLLLDDQVTRGLDATLAALDAHPNIEVRLFNPYTNRGLRLGNMAFDFARINRRMHNKSFIADGQVAIVGGRNIANEYYGADAALDYSDLDAALAGPSVAQASKEFDLYWNSESAYPAEKILGTPDVDAKALLAEAWDKASQTQDAQAYIEEVRNTPLLKQLMSRTLPLEWTKARIIYDDPDKVLQSPEDSKTHLLPQMIKDMGRPKEGLDIISPYFVPGKEGVQSFADLQKSGVQVRVLTNSLAATDVNPVHAGYKKYRKLLLQNGVMLYELKPSAQTMEFKQARRNERNEERRIPGGSSNAALHAKTFAVDRQRIFVGSYNLDPRSSKLNTEMGVVIESPGMARQLSDVFDKKVASMAYQVRLSEDGRDIEWVEQTSQGERIYTHDPGTSLFRRMWVDFLSILPIESQL